uniref:RNA helicase n=1 Tax=Globisporangium ultimum (strain ATCC 200006 / CBS 805.95 / DAOM BR144) TaxID=431595 RepID=K3X7H8_GLOUD
MQSPVARADRGGDAEDEPLYVPLKVRRQRQEDKLQRRRKLLQDKIQRERSDDESEEEHGETTSKRRKKHSSDDEQDEGDAVVHEATASDDDDMRPKQRSQVSLIDQAYEMRKKMEEAGVNQDKIQKDTQEINMLKEASYVQKVALVSAQERADGIRYTEAMKTTWKPPKSIADMTPEECDAVRKKWHILVEGEDIPPPIKSFAYMRFPPPIMDALKAKNILRPTPIQVQAIPCILAGRDIIGIAFTGSGKTVTFCLPLVMIALEEERKLPIIGREGPFGLIIGPSRELMRQTFEVVKHFTNYLFKAGEPEIRSLLCIGGEDKRAQSEMISRRGVHIVVATPGRLNDFLKSKQMNLRLCKYICLDEGDRMLDLGFDEEVSTTFNHFTNQRQTLLFSATMPQKFQDFAKDVLVKPILVNVGRAGAANLDVIQEVEYVKQDAKIKTSPPVVIFGERKGDVDDIYEYLILKGVEAASIHGGKDQEERNEAIALFKQGKKDVLVATDIAAKGLDFPDIKHVINFDMPAEIENYVHRIGRTGRSGKTGVATTFINKSVPESALLDLKHLLVEAKQTVPPVLRALEDPYTETAEGGGLSNATGTKGCAFCGGLGHRITDCPKVDAQSRKIGAGRRDYLGGKSEGYGGDNLGYTGRFLFVSS